MSTKEEIRMLDDVVEEFDIDTRISHHTSTFMDSKETPSDILQDSWSSFVVRNIAVKKFKMKYTDLQQWSMQKLSKFYREQLLLNDGTAVDDFRSLYPLPTYDIVNNPNLSQNNGY